MEKGYPGPPSLLLLNSQSQFPLISCYFQDLLQVTTEHAGTGADPGPFQRGRGNCTFFHAMGLLLLFKIPKWYKMTFVLLKYVQQKGRGLRNTAPYRSATDIHVQVSQERFTKECMKNVVSDN